MMCMLANCMLFAKGIKRIPVPINSFEEENLEKYFHNLNFLHKAKSRKWY